MSVATPILRMNDILLQNLIPAIYCRKSTESEERQILSLPAQRDEALKLVSALSIRKTFQYEEAKSAKTSGRRTEFARMIKDLRKGKINAIVCWKLDRLARNMIEGGIIIDLLQKGIIKAILTPHKVYYPNENALLMAVEFGAANQYSRDLSTNVKRGLLKRAKLGFTHGIAPIGFLNTRSFDDSKSMVVDPERLEIVRQMLEMYLYGKYSGGQIYNWAKDVAKLTTPKHKKSGNRIINRSWIYVILRNPIYAGFFYVQGERFELAKELPRLITEREHYRIIEMLDNKTPAKTQKHHVLFTGFIESPQFEFIGPDIKYQVICDCKHKFAYLNKTNCPKCHIAISNMVSPTYLHYIYYRNGVKKKRGESVKYLSEKRIEKEIIKHVNANLVFSQNFIEWCLRYYTELQTIQDSDAIIIRESQKKRKAELEAKKIRYRALLADGFFSKEEYAFDIAQINIELNNLPFSNTPHLFLSEAESIFRLGNNFLKVFSRKDFEAKRRILSRFGANLIWDEKTLIIQGCKPIQCLIDGLNWVKVKNPTFEPKTTLADKDETGVFEAARLDLLGVLRDVRKKWLEIGTDERLEAA